MLVYQQIMNDNIVKHGCNSIEYVFTGVSFTYIYVIIPAKYCMLSNI